MIKGTPQIVLYDQAELSLCPLLVDTFSKTIARAFPLDLLTISYWAGFTISDVDSSSGVSLKFKSENSWLLHCWQTCGPFSSVRQGLSMSPWLSCRPEWPGTLIDLPAFHLGIKGICHHATTPCYILLKMASWLCSTQGSPLRGTFCDSTVPSACTAPSDSTVWAGHFGEITKIQKFVFPSWWYYCSSDVHFRSRESRALICFRCSFTVFPCSKVRSLMDSTSVWTDSTP